MPRPPRFPAPLSLDTRRSPAWHWLRRRRLHARATAPWLSALGVALAAAGCAPAGPRADEAATQALRRSVPMPSMPGVALSVLQAGEARGPQLILVHGTPGEAQGWADYLLQPPSGLQVLALDRPGFGRSGPASAVPGLGEQAAAVHALMARDGRPVVLLGHSLGGAVVARVAADHPGQVSALVLLAASLDPVLEKIHPMQRVGQWPGVRALLPRALRNANDELMALQPELEDLATRLGSIRAKVVIVHGTQDDLVPVANVGFMQSRLQGARCVRTVLLEGRNHFLPWNAEAAVREAIAEAFEATC